MSVLWAVIGAAVVLRTWASVISTLVVPRRSRDRISRRVRLATDALYRVGTPRDGARRWARPVPHC